MLQIYEQFQTDKNCPLSLKVSHKCIKHIQELYNRGIKKPIPKDQEESSPNEVLDITHNLADICNGIQAPDSSEFNWGPHKT
jgi:hypothetical protein